MNELGNEKGFAQNHSRIVKRLISVIRHNYFLLLQKKKKKNDVKVEQIRGKGQKI